MADNLSIVITQSDDETKQEISRVTVDWFGVNRHEANNLTLDIINAMSGVVREADRVKYEAPQSDKRR